jgi:putative transposase
LGKALLKRKNQPGLLVYSDRVEQYWPEKMKELVQTFGLKQSMSRADDPYDNAFAESLWSRLKTEVEMPKGGYENLQILRSIFLKLLKDITIGSGYIPV